MTREYFFALLLIWIGISLHVYSEYVGKGSKKEEGKKNDLVFDEDDDIVARKL